MTKIIDTNQDTTRQIVHLRADGIETVIRYISPINPHSEKTVKEAEAAALAGGGIRLGLVCEGWGDFAHGGISAGAGARDGSFCPAYAKVTLQAPATTCIFYAVDTDANAGQIKKLVLPYFAAIKEAAGGLRVGVYGSGAVCQVVTTAGLAELAWLSCSMGWSESRSYLAAKPSALRLVQHTPVTLAHLDCDPNDKLGEFGDYLFGVAA